VVVLNWGAVRLLQSKFPEEGNLIMKNFSMRGIALSTGLLFALSAFAQPSFAGDDEDNDKQIITVTGPQGPAGVAGATGAPGKQGLAGKNGINGTNGAPGKQGLAGKNGINGINGAPGKQGNPGIAGKNGTNGINGAPGKQGNPGLAGKNGTNGINGAPGKQGKPGLAGKNGTIGLTGQPGTPGKGSAIVLADANGQFIGYIYGYSAIGGTYEIITSTGNTATISAFDGLEPLLWISSNRLFSSINCAGIEYIEASGPLGGASIYDFKAQADFSSRQPTTAMTKIRSIMMYAQDGTAIGGCIASNFSTNAAFPVTTVVFTPHAATPGLPANIVLPIGPVLQ